MNFFKDTWIILMILRFALNWCCKIENVYWTVTRDLIKRDRIWSNWSAGWSSYSCPSGCAGTATTRFARDRLGPWPRSSSVPTTIQSNRRHRRLRRCPLFSWYLLQGSPGERSMTLSQKILPWFSKIYWWIMRTVNFQLTARVSIPFIYVVKFFRNQFQFLM